LPFFQNLKAGSLPIVPIVNFLRCMAIIHAVLEREFSQVTIPQFTRLGGHATPKLPLLAADLDTLRAESVPSITGAVHAALDCAAEILSNAHNPLSLIGVLYVLEGSQNGALVLKQSYARCLNLHEEQLTYFGCYGDGTDAHWQVFEEFLNSLEVDEEGITLVTASAVRCFDWIEKICTALYPYSEQCLQAHVTAINFEAGDHAIPQSPAEIAMALRVGKIAWEQFPYLDQRYGERGKRFTSSDSCWLVALTRMPVETATRNLDWLRTVLASRGIPTVILERHLRLIQETLAVEFRDQVEMRTRFDQFLSGLEAERQSMGGVRAHLVEQFDLRFRVCAGLKVSSAAELIASAWIDEHCGIRGALASVRDWFADSERFSEEWIANVNEFVTQLKNAGRSSC
jgi:heme oxygenase